MKLHIIEYDGDWYLSIGKKAPWQNLQIRIPKFLAIIILKLIK